MRDYLTLQCKKKKKLTLQWLNLKKKQHKMRQRLDPAQLQTFYP